MSFETQPINCKICKEKTVLKYTHTDTYIHTNIFITGARYFCWVFPNETLINDFGQKKQYCKHGGFVYLFHEPGFVSLLCLFVCLFF